MTTRARRNILYALLAANTGVALLFWWQGSGSLALSGGHDALIAFGRLAGLLLALAILLQLVLIGRIRFIEQAFGHDRMNRAHRIVGYSIGASILLHPILLSLGYGGASGDGAAAQAVAFVTTWHDVWKAALSMLVIVAAVIAALPPLRRLLDHDVWHAGHALLYVSVALSLGHQLNYGDFSMGAASSYWLTLNVAVVGAVILYRFIRPVALFLRHGFRVEAVIPEGPGVVSILIGGRGLERFRFEAGQFANFSFMTKGLRAPHPFSFSEAYDGTHLRITAKAVGDYTRRLAEIPAGTKVVVDGPLGRFTAPSDVMPGMYLLIAGGIGITPIRALAKSLSAKGRDVVLLYSARSSDDFALRRELEKLPVKSTFLDTSTDGRLDADTIASLVPDFASREVYVCGPGQMIAAIVEGLSKKGVPRERLHFELFAYGT